MEPPAAGTGGRGAGPLGLGAWCLYDWANSAFPTVVTTFVFSAYFTKMVAPDTVTGTSAWGYAISLSALAVALAGPILGAVADHGGVRKPWLGAFTGLCVAATALLWFARPAAADMLWALVFVGCANFAFEMGMVFYNAMLRSIAPRGMIGRLSGWGWGLGYAGGLACLGVALVTLVQADPPWFGLDKDGAEHLRATALLAALWVGVFAAPLFLWTPDGRPSGLGFAACVKRGWGTLVGTVAQVRAHAPIARYLLAHMIYADGLNTLFAFGGIYAAGTFGMGFAELIVFGIALNVTAGLGAAAFAWADDWLGPKRVIVISISALAGISAAVLVVEDKSLFWALGLSLGVFVGPAQAASRSLMAHLAPGGMTTEMFGLFALSGKATAFLGPALVAWLTAWAGSQRAGMAAIFVFFVIGLALMRGVPDARR